MLLRRKLTLTLTLTLTRHAAAAERQELRPHRRALPRPGVRVGYEGRQRRGLSLPCESIRLLTPQP